MKNTDMSTISPSDERRSLNRRSKSFPVLNFNLLSSSAKELPVKDSTSTEPVISSARYERAASCYSYTIGDVTVVHNPLLTLHSRKTRRKKAKKKKSLPEIDGLIQFSAIQSKKNHQQVLHRQGSFVKFGNPLASLDTSKIRNHPRNKRTEKQKSRLFISKTKSKSAEIGTDQSTNPGPRRARFQFSGMNIFDTCLCKCLTQKQKTTHLVSH
eukprot:TRINITY_DN2092_c0_g1_i1.p1 TRINITY_DN2092_c0_g1~~TRINITY_DN2092_c0_g1_i1.p1  ORF type:complete len:212 (-),score=13.64 TRINITY_DN2092_c0_g1_i1:305-940(-)